jgi:hypothetical protein
MASKFVLNTGQLDTDYLSTPATLILDSTNRGKLDTNLLSSGEPIVVNDVATSALGGIFATVQSTPIVQVTATASFGAISSLSQAGVAHFVQGATNLGGLSSLASTLVTKVVQAQSLMGSLIGTIQSLPLVEVTAVSELGGLVANAVASSPNPPEPEQHYGSTNRYYQVKNKKKLQPVEIKPKIIDFEFEPLEPSIKTIFATSKSDLFGFGAMAQSRIDFSTEQDDLDLLMIL